MMKNICIVFISTLMIALSACTKDSSEDNKVIVYPEGEWRLVGWQYEGNWYEIDSYIVKPYQFAIYISMSEDSTVLACGYKSYINFYNVTWEKNIVNYKTYRINSEGSNLEESQFFEKHLPSMKSYQLNEHQLKIFFSDTDYFLFTNQFSDEPKMDDKWYDGPSYPYVAIVKSIDAEKDEVEVSILVVPEYPVEESENSEFLHHPGAQSICHFSFSEWSDKTIESGDKLFLYITSFQKTDANEPNRTFNCHVKPYEDRSLIENFEGRVRYDNHLGWYIRDENDWRNKTRYYPMKNVDPQFLQEELIVYYSGYCYTIPNNKDYKFIDLTLLINKKEMYKRAEYQDWIIGKWKFTGQENTNETDTERPHIAEFKKGGEAVYDYEGDIRNKVYYFLNNDFYETDLPVVCISYNQNIPYICHLDGKRLILEHRGLISANREHPRYFYERIE